MKSQSVILLFVVAACNHTDIKHEAQLIPRAINSTSGNRQQAPVAADRIVAKSSQELAREAVACRQGITQAQTDRKRGVVGYYFGGAAIPTYTDTLEQKYQMVIYRQGCVMDEGWECYNSYMDSVILAVYHVDLIAQEHTKALNALLAKRRRQPSL